MKHSFTMFFVVAVISLHAQISVNLLPLHNEIAAGTDYRQKWAAELRFGFDLSHSTNDNIDAVNTDLFVRRNFMTGTNGKQFHSYIGLGTGFGYNTAGSNFLSAFIPIGIQFAPFSNERLFFTAEESPYARFYTGYYSVKLQSQVGIGWLFGKKDESHKTSEDS